MEGEHFGISVVEMLSAGMVVLAHNSAGPKTDILGNLDSQKKFGFLCNDDEYIEQLTSVSKALENNNNIASIPSLLSMVESGSEMVKSKFSNSAFSEQFYTKLIKIS